MTGRLRNDKVKDIEANVTTKHASYENVTEDDDVKIGSQLQEEKVSSNVHKQSSDFLLTLVQPFTLFRMRIF